jgi:glycosyltransferase involved in cell wall biosynthesis
VSIIAILTGEVIGERLAGPAIRAIAMARALCDEHDVTLLASSVDAGAEAQVSDGGFRLDVLSDESAKAASQCEIIILQGDLLDRYPVLAASDACVIADLYDPYHLEVLEQSVSLAPERRRATIAASVSAIGSLLARGDLFLDVGGRQRDLWTGALASAGRVNEFTYADSPDLSRLMLTVPFGLNAEAPEPATSEVLRGVHGGLGNKGIGSDDIILWWGGGIYPWFDPETVIRATAALAAEGHPVHLVFAGSRHPNPDVGETLAARAAREYVDKNALNEVVTFLDWVPFADLGGYLLEADVMVSAHRDHVETRYAYRTRLLDGLWAGRPTVATGGDDLMSSIAVAGAGIAIAPGDVDGFANALRVLLDQSTRERFSSCALTHAKAHTWEVALAPLVEWCRTPSRAPDLKSGVALAPKSPSGLRRSIGSAARRMGLRNAGNSATR